MAYYISGFRLESISSRTVQVGGKFFVTGGERHAQLCGHLDYDYVNAEFKCVEKAPMLYDRFCHSATSYGGDQIIVAGACEECDDGFYKAEKYSVSENKWTELPDLNEGRFYHASCTLKDDVYIFCGKGRDYKSGRTVTFLRTIERLYMGSNSSNTPIPRWQYMHLKFPVESSPYGIYGITLQAVNDHEILIMGSYGYPRETREKKDVFVYNVDTE